MRRFEQLTPWIVGLACPIFVVFPLTFLALFATIILVGLTYGSAFSWVAIALTVYVQLQALLANQATLYAKAIVRPLQQSDEVLAVVFIAYLFIAKSLDRTIKLFSTPLDRPIFLFIFFGLLSGILNGNPMFVTLLGVQDMIGNFFFFYVFRSLSLDEEALRRYAKFLFIIACLFVLVGILEELIPLPYLTALGMGSKDYRFGLRRITSFAANPNRLSNFIFPFFMYLYATREAIRGKTKWTFLFGLCLFMTFSRQYWIGAVLSAFYFARLTGTVEARRKVRRFAIGAVVLLAALFALNTVKGLKTHKNALIPQADSSYFRIYAMAKSAEILWDHPIAGVGPGRFGGFVSRYIPSPIYQKYGFRWRSEKAAQIDMYWPQVWAETGIVGFGLYVMILIKLLFCLKTMLLRFKKHGKTFLHDLTLTAIAYEIGLLVASFGSPTFSSTNATMMFFALIGALYHQYEELESKVPVFSGSFETHRITST